MQRLNKLILALALCSPCAQPSYANPKSNDARLKVGAILTLSGNFAAAGDDSRRGIEAALAEEGNSSIIEVKYEDSKNEPSTAISALQKLVNTDKVAAIYTHRSSIGMALNPLSKRDSIPLLGAVGHQDFAAANKFAIQVWPRAHDEGRFVADEFKRRGFKRAAVMYTEDEWTGSVTEGFRARLKELGVELVFDQSALPNEQDFRTQVAKLKAAVPDGVYLNFLLPQIAPAITQCRAASVSGTIFSNFYLAKKEVRDAISPVALEGVRYVELDNDLPNLQRELGKAEPPPGLAVASYVSTLLLVQAAKENPPPKSTSELEAALLRQRQVRTADGIFEVKDRCVMFPLVVKVMANGKFVKEEKAG